MHVSTYLKVTASSSVRIKGCADFFARWFITFDGQECAPTPIDGVVYIEVNRNFHRPNVIIGHCNIKKGGFVNVAFNVGLCHGFFTGDAMTEWNSSTRIIVEEVEAPQN